MAFDLGQEHQYTGQQHKEKLQGQTGKEALEELADTRAAKSETTGVWSKSDLRGRFTGN